MIKSLSYYTLLCAMSLPVGAFGQSEAPHGLGPDVAGIGFVQVASSDDQAHGLSIAETRGDKVADVYVEEVTNAGAKSIVAVKFGWVVVASSDPTRVAESGETAWTTVRAVRPGTLARLHVKLDNLDAIEARAEANGFPSRQLDVVVAVVGARFDDGTEWNGLPPQVPQS